VAVIVIVTETRDLSAVQITIVKNVQLPVFLAVRIVYLKASAVGKTNVHGRKHIRRNVALIGIILLVLQVLGAGKEKLVVMEP